MKNDILHEKIDFYDMRDLVERACEMYKDRTIYSYREKPHDKEVKYVTFPEARDDIRAIATELRSRGVDGKHCVLIGKFTYKWALVYFSVLAAGGVLVPLDRDWKAEDLLDTAKKADIDFLFADSDIKDKIDVISEGTGVSPIFLDGADGETLSNLITLGREKFGKDSSLYFGHKIDVERLSLLVFTSGTTGKGKGVMLNQRAVLTDMCDCVQFVNFGRRTVGVLPPHHTYGSSVMLVGHMIIGSEIYISSGIKYVARELKEVCPEHLVLVPLYLETFYRKMQTGIKDKGMEKKLPKIIKISNFLRKIGIDLRKKIFKSLRDAMGGKVKMVISGGAPINGDIIDFFDAIGISTLNGYGITECAPIISLNHTKRTVKGSVGFPLEINDVKIVEPDEDGAGEICTKGSNVMIGYYKDEAATADAFTEDGYFRTGDFGKFGKGGALFITGRKKNLIILSNGKNVYPEEIENEFAAVPGVIDVIVYEGQSKRGLEYNSIVMEVYPDKDYFAKEGITDLDKYFKTYIDDYNRTAVAYKKIGVLKVRDEEFPKNTLRKILRFKLDMTRD